MFFSKKNQKQKYTTALRSVMYENKNRNTPPRFKCFCRVHVQ